MRVRVREGVKKGVLLAVVAAAAAVIKDPGLRSEAAFIFYFF